MATLEGADKLLQQLREIGKVRDGLRAAGKAAIVFPLAVAKDLAPVGSMPHRTYKGRKVKPGFLRKNIRTLVSVSRDGASVRALLGVRKEAFYGVQFVERRLGKSSLRGVPFIAPAFEQTSQKMLDAVVISMQATIAKGASK